MLLKSETIQLQTEVGSFCRNDNETSIPGAKQEGLMVYRRLVQTIMEDTLMQAFPITYKVMNSEDWDGLIKNFIQNHACQHVAIWMMPYEFYLYVFSSRTFNASQYPYLLDLLLFEWLEIELYTMEDKALPAYESNGEIMKDHLIINPELKIIQVSFPVHTKAISDWPFLKSNYFLLGYREITTREVSFLEISILHVWLIEKLTNKPLSLEILTNEASQLFSISSRLLLEQQIHSFLSHLKNQGVILGFQSY